MIVQTITHKRGLVVGATAPSTPPENARVYVQVAVLLPQSVRPIAITVAYHPSDVREVRPCSEP